MNCLGKVVDRRMPSGLRIRSNSASQLRWSSSERCENTEYE
jgi:hypothetical protein